MSNEHPQSNAPRTGRVNTVNLNKRDLDQLLDELETHTLSAASSINRTYVRRSFRQATIPLQLINPDGAAKTLPVACRDISRAGACVLHNTYIHVHTLCVLILPMNDGRHLAIKGRIVRCQHRTGIIHEIGIEFAEHINLRDMLDLDFFSDWYSLETVNPETLSGNVLFVDDSEADRRLMRHYLRDTHLSCTSVGSIEEAFNKPLDAIDLIITDYHLGDGDCVDLIDTIRDRAITTPVIVVTADNSELTRRRLTGADAQAFLAKPINPGMLLRAVAEFLAIDTDNIQINATCCMLDKNDPNVKLVGDFIKDLHTAAAELESAAKENNVDLCRRICMQLKGSSEPMGFPVLAEYAGRLYTNVTASMSVEEYEDDVAKLISMCKRAHTKAA